MSAAKDPNQNTTFIYSNFYHLYRKGKLANQAKEELARGVVLKSNSIIETPKPAEVHVVSSHQTEALSAWTHAETHSAKKELAEHLLTLRDARKKLSFMMQEIDELLRRA
jgi:hypothetical protein